jgi:hypothetical protein
LSHDSALLFALQMFFEPILQSDQPDVMVSKIKSRRREHSPLLAILLDKREIVLCKVV